MYYLQSIRRHEIELHWNTIGNQTLNCYQECSAVESWSKLSLEIFKQRHQSINGNSFRSFSRKMEGLKMNNSNPFVASARRPSFLVYQFQNRRVSQPLWMFDWSELLSSKMVLFVSNGVVILGIFAKYSENIFMQSYFAMSHWEIFPVVFVLPLIMFN